MSKIFISYRRQDSRPVATLIYEPLARHFEARFGAGAVFMDVHGIPLGVNFRAYLNEQVAKADLLIALIADRWLTSADEHGARRIDSPNDFVRIEIEAALKRGVPVVPVYVDDAKFLREADLPDSLKDLAWMNGYALSTDGAKFAASIASLIAGLEPHFAPPAAPAIVWPAAKPAKPAPAGGDPALGVRPGSGDGFRDGDAAWAPEMVAVPAGAFMMGTAPAEIDALCKEYSASAEYIKREGPQHRISIASPFAVGRFPVTRGEFSAFVKDKGHDMSGGAYGWTGSEWKKDPKKSWQDPGFSQDGSHPAVCVNWDDAKAYAKWLSDKTGKDYRLLSEAEWEYACRAGTSTPFWWGKSISTEQANYDGNYTFGGGKKGEYRQRTVPVRTFQPNPWGLYQVHGNVWEWCEDCWNERYDGAPADGSAWTTGDCSSRVLRGGSWIDNPAVLRAARRSRDYTSNRRYNAGFRVARTLNP
ncbi:MAG: SUMF1/EgtB/PvdO family nonheme iron enzyme [Rhodomicrobium sp.]